MVNPTYCEPDRNKQDGIPRLQGITGIQIGAAKQEVEKKEYLKQENGNGRTYQPGYQLIDISNIGKIFRVPSQIAGCGTGSLSAGSR